MDLITCPAEVVALHVTTGFSAFDFKKEVMGVFNISGCT
jgi:hypothetical protein